MSVRRRLRQLVCRHIFWQQWICDHESKSARIEVCVKCHTAQGTITKGVTR